MNSKNQKIFNLKSTINKIHFKNKPAIIIMKKIYSIKTFLHSKNKWINKIKYKTNL